MNNEAHLSDEERIEQAEARLEAKRAKLLRSQLPTGPRNPETRRELAAIRERADAMREDAEQPPSEAMLEQYRTDALQPAKATTWLRVAGVPLRYRELDYRPELIPHVLLDWAARFPESLSGAGALLEGGPGAGKTTAACWLLRECYLRGRVDVGVDYSGRHGDPLRKLSWVVPSAAFVHGSDLFEFVFQKRSDEIQRLEKVDLLVIDDWGVAYETQWPLAVMDRLVDKRWAEMRSTIVTTNVMARQVDAGEKSFEHRYPRSFSRICDRVGPGVVSMLAEDRRLA